jgi:hypothetical protein
MESRRGIEPVNLDHAKIIDLKLRSNGYCQGDGVLSGGNPKGS